jgi:hypothetical protein
MFRKEKIFMREFVAVQKKNRILSWRRSAVMWRRSGRSAGRSSARKAIAK